MNKEISVINVFDSADFNKIASLYSDPDINEIFGGYRKDRLSASEINFLICLNGEPIGFILLVREKERKDSLGIDIALKKEHRSKGYGKKAMQIFRGSFLKLIQDNLHVQIKRDDIVVNKIFDVLDKEYVESIEDYDFYKISSGKKQ